MNDMEDIRITECKNRHLYPSNLYKTCPYCKKGAEEIAKREALKKLLQIELHSYHQDLNLNQNQHYKKYE